MACIMASESFKSSCLMVLMMPVSARMWLVTRLLRASTTLDQGLSRSPAYSAEQPLHKIIQEKKNKKLSIGCKKCNPRNLPQHVHAVTVTDFCLLAGRLMAVAIGAVVHLEEMHLAGVRQL